MRFVLVFLLTLLPLTAEAQGVEVMPGELGFYFQKMDSTERFFMQGYQYSGKTSSCGGWGFVYNETGYTSFVGGPFCDFGDYFSIGAAIGAEFFSGETAEEGETKGRFALTAFLGTETSFLEVYYEDGASRVPWYRADLQLWGNTFFALGGIAQTGDGFGPRLRLSVPVGKSASLRAWVAPMFGEGPRRNLLGVEVVSSIGK